MCGIVGCASTSPESERAWLTAACDSLAHRGPDDDGVWWAQDGRVGLAHRRLAILDLSPMGRQPMHFDGLGLSIVFNGEIYNFLELRIELEKAGRTFHSSGDTEVLLAAYAEWGDKFLSKIDGMFAFGLYDAQNGRLILGRDRAGEKPLFYRLVDGESLHFASEIKAILKKPSMPRRISREALDCYLMVGYVPHDQCILDGYRKLPAGSALSFDLKTGSARVWRYWEPPAFEGEKTGELTDSDYVDELHDLLQQAVKVQLRSDVPVGILLSGGVDSSLITAVAASQASLVRTFSVSFAGHSVDESAHQRLIAEHFGTHHSELVADTASADLVANLAIQFDEPLADSSMIPTYLLSRMVREQCTVAVGGDGADELFGGYRHYSQLLRIENALSSLPEVGRRSLSSMARLGGHLLPTGFRGRNYLRVFRSDLSSGLPMVAIYFDFDSRLRLMRGYGPWEAWADESFSLLTPPGDDLLQRATRMDFRTYLPDDVLTKVDRASMLCSLEIRSPMLDRGIIEFAFGRVPSRLKANPHDRKILLKRLTDRLLPPAFDRSRKQGFSIPIADWLKSGPYDELFRDVLFSKDCVFAPSAVTELFRGQQRGLVNGDRLFALVAFELWRRAYSAYL